MSTLGLLGKEDLNFIIEYILSITIEQKYRDRFINDKLIPEYVMFEEDSCYFTYHFYFENAATVLTTTFDKEGYYCFKLKHRRLKIEKLKIKINGKEN